MTPNSTANSGPSVQYMSLLRTFSFKPPHQVSHEDTEIILQSKQKPFLPVEEEDVLLTRFESMLQWIYDSRNSMILRIYGSILASVTPKVRLGYKFSSVRQNENRSHSCSNRNAIHEIPCEKVLAWHGPRESLSRRRKRWAVEKSNGEDEGAHWGWIDSSVSNNKMP